MNQLSTISKPVNTLGNQMRTSTVTTAGLTTGLPQTAHISNAGGKSVSSTNMSMGMITNSNTSANYDMKTSMSLSQQGKKKII